MALPRADEWRSIVEGQDAAPPRFVAPARGSSYYETIGTSNGLVAGSMHVLRVRSVGGLTCETPTVTSGQAMPGCGCIGRGVWQMAVCVSGGVPDHRPALDRAPRGQIKSRHSRRAAD